MSDISNGAVQAPAEQTFAFQFTGQAGEYFRIWIVNIALSVLTLGIYSAWATVRTRRYFYAHTRVADTPFEYHASPVPILIGRLIAFGVLALIVFGQLLSPILAVIGFILLFMLFPWVLVRALRFRARYSAWRGLRFHFAGTYATAYRLFVGAVLLLPLTLGLLFPAILAWQARYVTTGHRFGSKTFEQPSLVGRFYGTYLAAFGLSILIVLATIVAFILIAGFGGALPNAGGSDVPPLIMLLIITISLAFYLGMYCVGLSVYCRVTNAVYGTARLGEHRFMSSLQTDAVIKLQLVNLLALVVTAGLAYPWTRIRMARYRASCLTLCGPGDFDQLVAEQGQGENAIGAEIGEAVFDLGF